MKELKRRRLPRLNLLLPGCPSFEKRPSESFSLEPPFCRAIRLWMSARFVKVRSVFCRLINFLGVPTFDTLQPLFLVSNLWWVHSYGDTSLQEISRLTTSNYEQRERERGTTPSDLQF